MANWEEFETYLKHVKNNNFSPWPLLFRGQGDANWQLKTTLERAGYEKLFFSEYYQTVSQLKPEIEAFTGREWDHPNFIDIDKLRDPDSLRDVLLQIYPYLLHLRHHGFPSPLLDWTHSPYIAAYFAFRQRPRQ
jgi:hypothetical protein